MIVQKRRRDLEDVGEQAQMVGHINSSGIPLAWSRPHCCTIDFGRRPGGYDCRAMTSRLIAQMKADSSRAIAVTTMFGSLPLRMSDRKRAHNRVCAFHAISRTRFGAAATFGCFFWLTRGGCR